jgi:hypothetical protein
MLTIIVALVTGVISGTLTGGVLGLWLARRAPASRALDDLSIDPGLDERITAASARWAADQGRPEAAGLIAKKARLLYALNERRSHRRRWMP